jgi:hypothetical protein
VDETAIGLEDLDPVVVGVCDVQPAGVVDHDAAGVPELADLPPFLAQSDGRPVGACFNRGQEGTGNQEGKADQTAEKTNGTSTTGASHGLIHHRES